MVETLRGVFVGETLGTFQLDNQHTFDEKIGCKLLEMKLRL